MLVLQRYKNETIVLGLRELMLSLYGAMPPGMTEKEFARVSRAVVTVVDVRGDKVRLGIQADKLLPVHRSEVQADIDAEQESNPG